jgi:hypothetical protein
MQDVRLVGSKSKEAASAHILSCIKVNANSKQNIYILQEIYVVAGQFFKLPC